MQDGELSAEERRHPSPKSLANLRPWVKGQSGYTGPRRARLVKLARRHTRTALKVLLELAQSAKNEETRRRAALAILHEGWGTPPTTQEVLRPDGPAGPLVSLNFAAQPGAPLSPEQAYALMVSGQLEPDPQHEAFRRAPIEVKALSGGAGAEYSVEPCAAPAPGADAARAPASAAGAESHAAGSPADDPRVAPRGDEAFTETWEALGK